MIKKTSVLNNSQFSGLPSCVVIAIRNYDEHWTYERKT